jgi:hypothetical protein
MKKRIIHAILLSCSTATLLIEKKSASPLSTLQKFQLKWHLSICDGCKQYQEQSALLDRALQKLASGQSPKEISNDALKNRIISELKK